MARTKNVGGGPGDEDPRPLPRQPTEPKGKATKKLAVRKHKYLDADTTRATAIAEATERAERGGAHSGVWIADKLSPEARASLERVERLHGGLAGTLMIGGRRVAIDEGQPQGSHSSRHRQQSRLRRDSRPRRQSRHLSHNFTALVVPVF